MTTRRPWARDELLIVLRYYLQTEFGRLHQRNPEIIEIAHRLDRTPGAVAMKASNFASLDPKITGTGRSGLAGASAADRGVWVFMQDALEAFEEESARAAEQLGIEAATQTYRDDFLIPDEVTDAVRSVVIRRKQSFFRKTVLAAYQESCAITGINVPELLNASHIIPWSVDEERRLDPTNGIALNALHDRAFDRGLITFTDDLRVIVSSQLRHAPVSNRHQRALADIADHQATLPVRFQPDPTALEYHREEIFKA